MKSRKAYNSARPALLWCILIAISLLGVSFANTHSRDSEAVACEMQFSESGELFYQVKNEQGLPLYYFKDIDQYPCDDEVCERMELRMYWDLWGNFIKLAMGDGHQLTKIGHKPFSDKDYERLHRLLINPNCNLQYYQLDDLTEKESETAYFNIDAVTAATIVNPTFDSVKGAVKTCYTLWKICYGDIQQEIRARTLADLAGLDNRWKQFAETIPADSINFKLDSTLLNYASISDRVLSQMNQLELIRMQEEQERDELKMLGEQFQAKDEPGSLLIYNLLVNERIFNKEIRNFNIAQTYFSRY